VAASSFERLYATWPELDERYGERGRHHTAEDNLWHLDHLDEAVAAGDPELFAHYTDWLVGLMLPRGLMREHVAGAYGFLADALERVECPRSQESHRRELVDTLRINQARVLGETRPAGSGPSQRR
jgi:hypothetical protein